MSTKRSGKITQGHVPEGRDGDALLRVLIENASDIISRHQIDGTCLYVSPAVRTLLGREPADLLGLRSFEIMHPEDLEMLSRFGPETFLGEGATLEYRLMHADGTWRTFETTLRTLTDAQGEPLEIVAVARDVTARKQAEADATRTREKILRTYEQMSEPFFTLDREWRFVYANPLTARMRGNDMVEVLGKSLWELFPDLKDTKFYTEYHRAMAEGVSVHFEEFHAASGRWYQVHAYPSEEGLAVHFRDVTATRGVMEKLQKSEQRYAEAYEVERAAAEHLRALDDMKQAFLTSVSHELRTPLTALIGYAETLATYESRLSPSTRTQILKRLVVNARRLHTQVGDLLDLDRLVASSFTPSRSRTEIGALVREVVDASEVGDSHPVTVTCDEAIVFVDASLVERIVRNLLSNAVLHTQRGTPVWVNVRAVQDGAIIEVDDAGPGIDREIAEAIFEPFRQGPTITPSSPRVGIGLSLVARFTELHAGRAWVEDRPGGGAAFRVFLPAGEVTPLRTRTMMGSSNTLRKRARRPARDAKRVSERARDRGSQPLSGTRPVGS